MARDIEKQRAHWRNWYHKNKDAARKNRQKSFDRVNGWFKEYKKTLKCSVCGFDKHPAALDFHHRDGEVKIGDIGTMSRRATKVKLLAEIAKCDVLCANCHRILHASD